jgi:acetoin:2,6-dichlorophenolindophenol oxidoreductase subunit alpha
VTYRWKGHSKSDKNLYRTREEIDRWREQDPIARYTAALLDAGTLTEAEAEACRADAREAVRDAVRTANAAPDASADELTSAVYAA